MRLTPEMVHAQQELAARDPAYAALLKAAIDGRREHREELKLMTSSGFGRTITRSEAQRLIFAPYVRSDDRAEVLLKVLGNIEEDAFWPSVLGGWPTCDDTRGFTGRLAGLLRKQPSGSARPYMGAAEIVFLDALPDPVPIYRGCPRAFVRGISWTTDVDVAKGFAEGHRGIIVPDACLASALISKAHVFAVFVE